MWSSKRFANTIIVMMHYREHHMHSTTQRKNWPQKSRNKLFFFFHHTTWIQLKHSIPNEIKKPAAWRMHHNNSTQPQMSHDYFDARLGLHKELASHYQLGLWLFAIIALRRLAGHHFIAEGQSAIAAANLKHKWNTGRFKRSSNIQHIQGETQKIIVVHQYYGPVGQDFGPCASWPARLIPWSLRSKGRSTRKSAGVKGQ